MKNKLLFFICAFMCSAFYAQTGFQTETPQRTVHVNGSLQVTNEINVGGTKDTADLGGQIVNYNPTDYGNYRNI